MKRLALLPDSLPPIGVNREQAAALVGISSTLFDQLVREQLMPDARVLKGRLVWDVAEITGAFRAIPHRSQPIDGSISEGNPWDNA